MRRDQVISLDVDQAFDARLQFHERAVVGDVDDAADDVRARRDSARRRRATDPAQLLEAEGDALLILVELQDFDLDLVATLSRSRGCVRRPQRHVGDVQQAVDAAEVDERAVVGQVLDGAGHDRALFQVLEGGRTSCASCSSSSISLRETTTLPRCLLSLMT